MQIMNHDEKRAMVVKKVFEDSRPVIMGILNVTPDSFYDGGCYNLPQSALKQAGEMVNDGAEILDLGAVSTRPFAEEVSETEEWNRLKNVLPAVRKAFPETLISIDTFRSSVARQAVLEGADIINDISGGQFDQNMFGVISATQAIYVMMHTRGNPKTMQQNPVYDDVVEDVTSFFVRQLQRLKELGVEKNIILDPGFGFGKTVDHNYQLIHGMRKIRKLGFPVLAGLSRKSMINKVLGTTPATALNGTTALNMLALVNGAGILRVHDVKAAVEVVRLFEVYRKNGVNGSF